MAEFIRGKVSEVNRQSYTQTLGYITGGRSSINGMMSSFLQHQSTLKLENDNRTFSVGGGAIN